MFQTAYLSTDRKKTSYSSLYHGVQVVGMVKASTGRFAFCPLPTERQWQVNRVIITK